MATWTVHYNTKTAHTQKYRDFPSMEKAATFFFKLAQDGGARSDPFIASDRMWGFFGLKELPWYYFRKENEGTAVEFIVKYLKAHTKKE